MVRFLRAVAVLALFLALGLAVVGCSGSDKPSGKATSDKMGGDKMGGDKMGGDKMGGDKMDKK